MTTSAILFLVPVELLVLGKKSWKLSVETSAIYPVELLILCEIVWKLTAGLQSCLLFE